MKTYGNIILMTVICSSSSGSSWRCDRHRPWISCPETKVVGMDTRQRATSAHIPLIVVHILAHGPLLRLALSGVPLIEMGQRNEKATTRQRACDCKHHGECSVSVEVIE